MLINNNLKLKHCFVQIVESACKILTLITNFISWKNWEYLFLMKAAYKDKDSKMESKFQTFSMHSNIFSFRLKESYVFSYYPFKKKMEIFWIICFNQDEKINTKMFAITHTRTKVSVNGILIYFEAFLMRYFQNCFLICPYNSKKKREKTLHTYFYIQTFSWRTCF